MVSVVFCWFCEELHQSQLYKLTQLRFNLPLSDYRLFFDQILPSKNIETHLEQFDPEGRLTQPSHIVY